MLTRASGWAALSNGSKYCASNSLRKRNRRKTFFRVEIVFARLVDDAYEPVLRSIGILENTINLSAFQGNLVAFIVDAYGELFGCR